MRAKQRQYGALSRVPADCRSFDARAGPTAAALLLSSVAIGTLPRQLMAAMMSAGTWPARRGGVLGDRACARAARQPAELVPQVVRGDTLLAVQALHREKGVPPDY